MEKVVKSFNIFIDTDRGDSSSSKGDDFELELNSVNINCDKNQFIRLNLNSFTMHKVWTNLNQYNTKFKLSTKKSGGSDVFGTLDISSTNFNSVKELAENFAQVLGTELLNRGDGTTFAVANLRPDTTSTAGTEDYRIRFDLAFANDHNLENVAVQFWEKYNSGISDIYSVLGGKRIKGNGSLSTDAITSSITIDSTSDPKIVSVACPFPGQRFSESYVYLHCQNITSHNLETQSLRDSNNPDFKNNKVHNSTIFARFPQSNEFISYQAPHNREFFVDVPNKHLVNLRLQLKDSHGNPLPQSPDQSTLGNLNFNAVIRVDIIEKYALEDLERPLVNQNFPRRYNNVITQMNGYSLN